MSEINDDVAISVPQMVNLDSLIKIVIAYSKAGGSQREVTTKEVAQISGLDPSNVGLNNKFFASIGLIEGRRGAYKLTSAGSSYAQALDWGRLEEAQIILRRTIKDKPLVQKTVSFVELNKPVSKEVLIAKVAGFASVPNEPRFSTGIKAFVEMLTLTKLLQESKEGSLETGVRDEPKKPDADIIVSSDKGNLVTIETKSWNDFIDVSKRQLNRQPILREPLTLTLTLNIDNNTDPERLKQLVRAIREAFSQ
jgi:hypothetical protein